MGIISRSTPVERTLRELDKARDVVGRWESEHAAKFAELADLESRIGEEVLADETAVARLSAEAQRLRAEVDVAARTVSAATPKVTDAGRAVLKAHSAALKANADHLRAEVEQRQAKTDKLLAELSAWEGGAEYRPFEPHHDDVVAAGAAGIRYTIPRTEALRRQVARLEAQARKWHQHAEDSPEQVADHVARLVASADAKPPAPLTVPV